MSIKDAINKLEIVDDELKKEIEALSFEITGLNKNVCTGFGSTTGNGYNNAQVTILQQEIDILKATIRDLENQLREEREKVSPYELAEAKKALEDLAKPS